MPRGAKTGKKRSRKEASDHIVEDLDLDVTANDALVDDEDVVHDRRTRKGGLAEDDMLTVLPSDAHRLDGYGEDELGGGGYQEEEELAVVTEKGLRRRTAEEDFDVAGVSVSRVAAKRDAGGAKGKSALDVLDAAPAIEAIERDFASLTTTERLAVLKKESPELLKLLDDLKTYMVEVKTLAQPLHELLYERKLSASDKNLVSFLETKVQLMLSYCMHVTFYLLLKAEGRKVEGHPVIDHLVEIRVYLEKMWPLEEKLQYSLNRLLSGKSTAAAHLSELRPLKSGEGGVFEAGRAAQNTEARERRQQLRQMKEAEDLEREEQSAMTRVRTKKASQLNGTAASSTIAPVSYQEDEDQFFSRLAGGADDADDDGAGGEEEGLSLMEVLRRRQKTAGDVLGRSRPARKAARAEVVDEDEGEDGEGGSEGEEAMGSDDDDADYLDGDEDGDEDLEAVWEEERERAAEESSRKAASAASARRPAVEEVERRKAGKKIESHRGLTKARPKDRKNPRVAQRRKYERGMQVHKSQSRNFQAESEGGFVGVRALRPGVVRGTKL